MIVKNAFEIYYGKVHAQMDADSSEGCCGFTLHKLFLLVFDAQARSRAWQLGLLTLTMGACGGSYQDICLLAGIQIHVFCSSSPAMVNFHPTCTDYSIPGVGRQNYTQIIRAALTHATELIATGHAAVQGNEVSAVTAKFFARYFGPYTAMKHNKVRGQCSTQAIVLFGPKILKLITAIDLLSAADLDHSGLRKND